MDSMHKIRMLQEIESVETIAVLKKLSRAHQALAELKGVAKTMPNQTILISTLSLQEAKDSSAIENIITTQDDLYCSDKSRDSFVTFSAKEVHSYADALLLGYEQVMKTGLLTKNDIIQIQIGIEHNSAGFRKVPGTTLKNSSGETIYTPPQHPDEIEKLMDDLELFINDPESSALDPLTKMTLIHHQFESIHPFYDGNGRTGRVINILYLVLQNLLETPVLYLSRYINQNKTDYYRLLQSVRDSGEWEPWILFMLDGVETTSRKTTELIIAIRELMQKYKLLLRSELPKIYSQDLINNLFKHPYTKIDFVVNDLQITRQTASRYLDEIVKLGILSKQKIGKEYFFLNHELNALIGSVSGE